MSPDAAAIAPSPKTAATGEITGNNQANFSLIWIQSRVLEESGFDGDRAV